MNQTFVILGASLAGAKAAETLRSEGFDGSVVLVGEEPERPYERPPLSKGYLRGESEREEIYVRREGFYQEQAIELRTGTRAISIEPDEHVVVLDGGERLGYDRLLLTTGAAPRRFEAPGADLDGVKYLRTVADSDRLAESIRRADRVLVVGGGWIGSEVAASARELGRQVAMVVPGAAPLQSVLGPEVAAIYRDLHADHGVELHLGTSVESLRGADRVEQAHLADGSDVAADLVVLGIGALPRVDLGAAAGLDVDNGIVVDANLRASAPDIFAAGDVASVFHPAIGRHIRVEHWANALNQGPVAAKNMLGVLAPYDRVPYFYSDQYDFSMEYSGYPTPWDRVVFRGDPVKLQFVAFWLAADHVVAGMNANIWDVNDTIQRLIRDRVPVDPEALADPGTPLEGLGQR